MSVITACVTRLCNPPLICKLHNHRHYEAYDAASTCGFAAGGSRLAWGDDHFITSNYPNFTVAGWYRHMKVDLQISATKQVSWFVRSPIDDHLSLLATFIGSITDDRGTTKIVGMCPAEYARSMNPLDPLVLSRHSVPQLKRPLHFFTYQILHLDECAQLLPTDMRADGMTLCRLAHVRNLNGEALVYWDVAFVNIPSRILEAAQCEHLSGCNRLYMIITKR
ncbi:hypothetical protein MAC_09471 [Metarhizium acridum CQMa 102]|uniref:Uncharacterized protein n=1 Tax=Metarhizium acridum (strain CQMa 102) TaxID=655827 RepID=E9EHX3_METAQ|nr:uncharacterized protein MAC_09471 [Metarhizium acridum CQMa 102]EFY84496.1 hypothetical protein MAC_09471 [Metarhizium acridum CQMa 102]